MLADDDACDRAPRAESPSVTIGDALPVRRLSTGWCSAHRPKLEVFHDPKATWLDRKIDIFIAWLREKLA